jgi:dTDP-4-dehydrorhamnose reductase
MKVLVIGANGALGSDLLEQLGPRGVGVTHAQLELADPASIALNLNQIQPSHVVNTAAFHQVPLCESRFEDALRINALGVRHLALACRDAGIHLCHISTDYVFSGTARVPYREEDPACPVNAYGISKLAGEQAILALGDNASIVRSCGLYGRVPCRAKGGNFITTLVRLGRSRELVTVVNDEWVARTYTRDLAQAIIRLLECGGRGLYHITQSGQATWFDLACQIFRTLELPARLEPIPAALFQTDVRRPPYSLLDNTRFIALTGLPLRSWQEALAEYLAQAQFPPA